jgi:ABC-type antimicrobial peptide transport system, permease component
MDKLAFYVKLAFSNVKKNKQIYIPYILSGMGACMMFYILRALMFGISEDMYGVTSMTQILELGQPLIVLFSVLFLFYTNSFVIKRRKKEFGLYNILGMEKKHISLVVSIETCAIALISILGGLLTGILFSKFMFLFLAKLLENNSPIAFVIPSSAIQRSILFYSGIYLATLLYNLLQIKLTKPINLLHGDKIGEKEPKANWVFGLVGIASLAVAYYISITTTNPLKTLPSFLLAVALVVVGTYCLFMASMTVILKVLKRNKTYYYKSNHFATVSGMIYRMKQNSAGLATICILSTFILVMISTSFSLYVGIDDFVEKYVSNDITIDSLHLSPEETESLRTHLLNLIAESDADIENAVSNSFCGSTCSIEGNNFAFKSFENAANDLNHLTFVLLSDYNQNFNTDYTLEEDEIYFHSPVGNTFNEIKFDGVPLRVKEFTGTQTFSYTPYNSFGIDFYTIMVKDMDTLFSIFENSSEDIPIMQHTFGFDLNAPTKEQPAIVQEFTESAQTTFPNLSDTGGIRGNTRHEARLSMLDLYAGLFFLGLFLGLTFTMALMLIIYYKQITEGYEDKKRFEIMQNVGMSHSEVKRTIRSQILLVFFMPLVASIMHLGFAMPILIRIMILLAMSNTTLILIASAVVVGIFALLYTIIYSVTAKIYYGIVEK